VKKFHAVHCAENSLLLRRRMSPEDRHYVRIFKLTLIMWCVIHLSACLWFIIARIQLKPDEENPEPTPFFPDPKLYLGRSGILNAYLHAIHWAWVNLAGIGNIDSTPETTLECLVTLFTHICGATLYTIVTGNVVAILETMTEVYHLNFLTIVDIETPAHLSPCCSCHAAPNDYGK
jgi:hypothetical protein